MVKIDALATFLPFAETFNVMFASCPGNCHPAPGGREDDGGHGNEQR
jgi:hypothetical protein